MLRPPNTSWKFWKFSGFVAGASFPLSKAFKDLSHPRILALSLLPLLALLVLYAILLTVGLYNFNWFLERFPASWYNYAVHGEGILSTLLYAMLSALSLIELVVYVTFAVGLASIILTSFIAPAVVGMVHKEHYPLVALEPPPFGSSLGLSVAFLIKTLAKFLIVSLICVLLGFIGLGLVGLFISMFAYFRFFALNLNYEVALNIMGDSDYQVFARQKAPQLFLLNLIIFLPLYIPLLGFFILPWQVLVLAHFMLASRGDARDTPLDVTFEENPQNPKHLT